MPRKFKRSPLALAVLTLLHEAPMHPYKMQRLIKDRGKDQVINVEQRASLYQTINQLLRAGLITFLETKHQDGLPDQTVYKLTDEGHEAALNSASGNAFSACSGISGLSGSSFIVAFVNDGRRSSPNGDTRNQAC